jgi:transposase
VIGDNARFHNCRAARQHLAQWGHRIELHYLPKYAPETNPIERVWWHLRATITRNHRGPSIEELLEAVYDWAETQSCFSLQTASFRSQYQLAA